MPETTFEGFPADTLDFLNELSGNNDKTWFDANKQRYRDDVIANVPAFVATLGERLQAGISPGIVYDTRTNGAGSMMRIYRDTRFSKRVTQPASHPSVLTPAAVTGHAMLVPLPQTAGAIQESNPATKFDRLRRVSEVRSPL